MRPQSLIPGFVLRLLFIYVLMILPWPGLEQGYAALYRSASSALARALPLSHRVSLEPLTDDDRAEFAGSVDARALALDDTKIVLRAGDQQATVLHSSWYSGYIPTALLAALILATPVTWAYRLRSLLWGLVLVDVYLGLRMGATFIVGGMDDPFDWLPAPELRRSALSALAVTGPGSGPWYVVPFLIWILLVHRRVYLELIVGPEGRSRVKGPHPGRRRARRAKGGRSRRRSRAR
jgi:hypothetical protein